MRRLFGRIESHGQRPALIGANGMTIDYAQLAERADAAVAMLADGRCLVLIECINTIEALAAYIGALRNGHVALLGLPGSADGAIAAQFPPDAVFRADGRGCERRSAGIGQSMHPDLALLLATSGSSGAPKLVRLSHDAVAANAASIADYLAITDAARAITSLPFHYSYGLSVVNSHLLGGATLLVTDASVVDPEFWDFFRREAGTSFAGVPFSYELLERQNFRADPPPTLRTLTQAGGKMLPDLTATYARWSADRGIRYFTMYGQTEATARMAYLPPDLAIANPDSIGIAIPGGSLDLRNMDADGHGELMYRGPNVMMGYADRPADLARGPEIDVLATGDIAYRNADDLFCISGRLSRFSKIAGYRIGLDDLQARLAVDGVGAIVAGDDELLVLAVLAGDPAAAAATIVTHTRLPPASVIAYSLVDVPRLSSGKTDFRAVLAEGHRLVAARNSEPPASLAMALAQILGRLLVSPDDSFQSLGGDSLSYVQASMAIEDHVGVLPDGWEAMTLAELGSLATPPRSRWQAATRRIESETLLRAVAIVGVVGVHATTWVLAGGASLLLLLAGYNLARFHLPRLRAGDGLGVLGTFAARILLPYYLILGAYAFHRHVDLASWLLVSNIQGRFQSLLEPFWFLEALTHCLLLFVAAYAIPAVRRASPVQLGLVVLGVALAVKLAAVLFWADRPPQQRTADAVLYLYVAGFLLSLCKRPSERIALAGIALAGTAYDWGLSDLHIVWMAVGLGGLALVRHIRLPRALATMVAQVASASFYIYLTHNIIVNLFVFQWHIKPDWLAVPVAVLAGIATREAVERTAAPVSRWRREPVSGPRSEPRGALDGIAGV